MVYLAELVYSEMLSGLPHHGNGSLGSERPSDSFADNLQNLRVSKEKALGPGFWEVRAKDEVVDESDEESVASKGKGDDSRESDDSEEEA